MSFLAEAQGVAMGARRSSSVIGWVRASGTKRPAEERRVIELTVERYPTRGECWEHTRRKGSSHRGPRELGVKEWIEDLVSLYFIEEDLGKFEELEQETQEVLQVAPE